MILWRMMKTGNLTDQRVIFKCLKRRMQRLKGKKGYKNETADCQEKTSFNERK